MPATFTVLNTLDSGAGSLRDMVAQAEAAAGADNIQFDPGLTPSAGAIINLGLTGDNTAGPSALIITSNITILGPTIGISSNGITLNTTGIQRMFYVSSTGSLAINALNLTGGMAQGGNGVSGGGGAAGLGGAVFNQGSLTLQNVTLSGNQAIGGGSYNLGNSGGGGGLGSNGNGGVGGGGAGGGPNGGAGGGPNGGGGGFGGGGGGGGFFGGNGGGGDGGFGGGGGGGASGFGGAGLGGGGGVYGGSGGGNGGSGSFGNFAGGGGAGMGGAIFNYTGTVTITNSKFSGNKAMGGTGASPGQGLGGGVYNYNGNVTVSTTTIPSTFGPITRSTRAHSTEPDPQSDQDGIFSMADGTGNEAGITINDSTLGGDNSKIGIVTVVSINGGLHTTNNGTSNTIGTASGFAGETGGLAARPFLTSGALSIGSDNALSGTEINLYANRQGTVAKTITPYPGFKGEVRVALGENSGTSALIFTAPGEGGGPHIKILDGKTGETRANFFAYDPGFTGGVYLASADFNNDGTADIITGAGKGGGPHVKIFDGKTLAVLASFYAYDQAFKGGVSVSAYDYNHDGTIDLATGAGPGGGPHVKIFDGTNFSLLKSFFAYDPAFRGGVFVALGDLFSDGTLDLITGAGQGATPQVNVFDANTLQLKKSFLAYDVGFTGGVRVGIIDSDGDGRNDLITGPGKGGGPNVRVFSGNNLDLIASFFVKDIADRQGVFVS